MANAPLQTGRPERPITHAAQDAMNRAGFVARLADALIDNTGKATGVVVGLAGPWGSGKSSILNLLEEEVASRFANAIVVRFDPWLVSGRNDLIIEFVSELLGTIRANYKQGKKIRTFAKDVAKYGAHVAPAGNLLLPGVGAAAAGGLKAVEAALGKSESLSELREKLLKSLDELSSPVVVLIDELDRVDDEEIKTVAQLVRSVVDFPGISYVLAYDADRVVQALGANGSAQERFERGRAYLEKIVQLQIPLPIGLAEERLAQLEAELSSLASSVHLPDSFASDSRYQEVAHLLVSKVLYTPRDIKRLVGIYHVIGSMVGQEVDWVDTIKYCALLCKAPRTVEKIKSNTDFYVQDPLSIAVHAQRIAGAAESEALLQQALVEGEGDEGIQSLLKSLFPRFVRHSASPDYPDALCYSRPLTTVLRLGLLPGGVSRAEVEALASQSAGDVEQALRSALIEDRLSQFLDRFEEVYPLLSTDHIELWTGIQQFCEKSDGEWLTETSVMRSVAETFANLLIRVVRKEVSLQPTAEAIIRHLAKRGDLSLAPIWMRRQIMHLGLFRWTSRQGQGVDVFEADELRSLATESAMYWKRRLIKGSLLNHIWDLHALYGILDVGIWSAPCKTAVRKAAQSDVGFDAIVLQMFGRNYFTENDAIETVLGLRWFAGRLAQRIESLESSPASREVIAALEKARDGR